jgi:hypothetical protein
MTTTVHLAAGVISVHRDLASRPCFEEAKYAISAPPGQALIIDTEGV